MQIELNTGPHGRQTVGQGQSVAAAAVAGFPLAGEGPGAAAASASDGVPPDGNTGALNTVCGLVDCLEVTFHGVEVQEVLKRFTPEGADPAQVWVVLPVGRNGYRQGAVRGKVRVYWDGAPGMGVHLDASGSGVRQLEAEGIITEWEGSEGFAAQLLAWNAYASRVDVALDDRVGHLTPARVQGAVDAGRCVSRFRVADPRQRIQLKDGLREGWSLYLGAPSSRIRVRFYDKAAEQASKGVQVDGHWVRCELQARDERAELVLKLLAKGGGLAAVAGLLFNYIDFKQESDDTNRSRWRTCAWWSAFLGEVQKVRVSLSKVVREIETVAAWFQRQVAPSLALLWHSPAYGERFLLEMFSEGSKRLSKWQLAAIGCGGSPLSVAEVVG